MTVELASLRSGELLVVSQNNLQKIFVTLLKWLDENQAIDKRIILPYVTGTLKHSMYKT